MAEKNEIRQIVNTSLWLRNTILAALVHDVGMDVVENDKIPACGYTDGTGIYINWAECSKIKEHLTNHNYLFIVVHELMHILTLTFERRNGRDRKLWNYATDYAINDMILTNRESNGAQKPMGEMLYLDEYKTPDNPTGQAWLYESKYHNMSAEQIYEDILQEFKNAHGGKTPEEVKRELADKLGEAMANGQGGGDDSKDGSPDDVIQKWLDENCKGKPIDFSDLMEHMSDEVKQKVKASVNNTLDKLQKSASKGGSMLERALSIFLQEPPFDWRGYLNKYLKNFIRNDFTWRRPNRRSNALETILPGTNVEAQIKVAIAIDTSGSVGDDEVRDFLSHIQKIMRSFRGFEIDIWCFSTHVHNETLKTYNQHNRDMSNFELASCGGTDIASNFEWLSNRSKRYDVFICMTDGYDNISNLQFDKYPTIWAITQNDNFTNPPGVRRASVMHVEF